MKIKMKRCKRLKLPKSQTFVPTDTNNRLLEDGDTRITEDGNFRTLE